MSDKLCGNHMFIAGNIDQAQYCERIKGIIELLGSKLSLDELSKIWRIQVRPSNADTHAHLLGTTVLIHSVAFFRRANRQL